MKIYRPQEIYALRLTGRATLANGGGKTSSSQATNTTSSLTNTVSSTDSRSVASDEAIALGGDGNTVVKNTNTSVNTSNTDNSTASFMSNSGNSYADSGNVSYSSSNSYTTTTDFGSVQASIDAMKATASAALGLGGDVSSDAISALSHQSDSTMALIADMFSMAKATGANSQGTAMQAIGLANNATAQATEAAGNDAKHMRYVMIGGGVLLAILILKKK
jgi:hypothetical protein